MAYSDIFCRVYNELGWNYYPEAFGQQLLTFLSRHDLRPQNAMDLGCGTGILCRLLHDAGICATGTDLSEGMIAIAREANPDLTFAVADMITFCPEEQFDLVTCTGDALNHIGRLSDVERIFCNVARYTAPGGYFIFDILNEKEVSGGEPFEMDFSDTVRVWFQMTRPEADTVNLCIRVYENDRLQLEENIRETLHDPAAICAMLERCGFTVERCAGRLLDDSRPSTTWFVVARKI